MKKFKRFLGCLLILTMTVSLVPSAAFAVEANGSNINGFSLNGNESTVYYDNSEDDALIVSSVFDKSTGQMTAVGAKAVDTGNNEVTNVHMNGTTPGDFEAKAYMLDQRTLSPLTDAYALDSEVQSKKRVIFHKNDGSGFDNDIISNQVVAFGEKITAISDPVNGGCTFTGWYLEPEAVTRYDFNSRVIGDLNLYAGWQSNEQAEQLDFQSDDDKDTIYSITGVELSGNRSAVLVTLNTKSKCTVYAEFYNDSTTDEDWEEDGTIVDDLGELLFTCHAETPECCELTSVSVPIGNHTLPDNFFIRCYMLDENGNLVGNGDSPAEFICIDYCKKYKEFDSQTIDKFYADETIENDHILNFDNQNDTNYAVLNPDVKVIQSAALNSVSEPEIVMEGDDSPSVYELDYYDVKDEELKPGDIVYISGTDCLFKVGDMARDGSRVEIEEDPNAELTDYYSIINVDMKPDDVLNVAADNGQSGGQPMPRSTASLTKSISSDIRLGNDYVGVEGKITGEVGLTIKIVLDIHIFKKSYVECSVIADANAEIEVSVTAEYETAASLLDGLAKPRIDIPTPVPGLTAFVKCDLPVKITIKGSITIKYAFSQKSGFQYDTNHGRRDIKEKSSSLSITGKVSVELKIGVEIGVGVSLVKVLSAEVSLEAGVKLTAEMEAGDEDINDTIDEKHACHVCIKGEAKWYVEAHAKLSYNLFFIKGNIFDIKILGLEGDIVLPGGKDAKFYISIINPKASQFAGKPHWGGGECPNKKYRIEVKLKDNGGKDIIGSKITIKRKSSGPAFEVSGNSPFVTYLYAPGTYEISATIDGTPVSQSVPVKDEGKKIVLSPTSRAASYALEENLEHSSVEADNAVVLNDTNVSPEDLKIIPNSGGAYSCKKDNAAVGNNYAVIVVSGKYSSTGRISRESFGEKLLYIKEVKAEGNTVNFNNIRPLRNAVSTVIVAGDGESEIVGYILPDGIEDSDNDPDSMRPESKRTDISECSIAKIPAKVYTGSHIIPKPVVKLGKTALVYGRDFKYTYADNVDAGEGKVTVVGIGEYCGRKTQSFEIKPRSIKTAKITADSLGIKLIHANPITVVDGIDVLARGRDYKYTITSANVAKKGTAKIKVEGMGNYDKSVIVNVPVVDTNGKTLITATSVILGEEKTLEYDGKPKTPEVLSVKGLDKKDYTVSYKNNKNAGTAYIVVTAKGKNAVGKVNIPFRISPISGKFELVTVTNPGKVIYNRKLQTPVLTVIYNGKKLSTSFYSVEYVNNLNVGFATAKVKGKGNYSGLSGEVRFNVYECPMNKVKIAKSGSSYVLTFNGVKLVKGVDYYTKPTVVKGKNMTSFIGTGNFTGTINK